MPEKSAAHQKKVDEAVRILNTTTGVNVSQAMILAGFPKKDTANKTVRRMIHCRLKALEAKQTTPRRDAPTIKEVRIVTNNDADLSALTGKDNDPTASGTTTTMTTGLTHPKPKRKHILVCDIADHRTRRRWQQQHQAAATTAITSMMAAASTVVAGVAADEAAVLTTEVVVAMMMAVTTADAVVVVVVAAAAAAA
jgi:hypothetical protein